jgi:hypothetical protein|tara:strand:+ start:68 stop:268 length:201 start_codon:yes stop_codon:yes gene_type:complete
MTEERRWKIQELTTEGWTSIDPSTDSLIKADCNVELRSYIENGLSPDRIRAVPAESVDEGLPQLDS